MPSLTVENYLKAILQNRLRSGAEWISTGKLAQALEVSPGTVTSMLKTLAESGHAEYKPYSGVRLTEAGEQVALKILRRHRLIELFLVRTLDLSWDQVHEEAENMEHAVSDFLIDQIDEHLGRPEYDPHGDPIPTANGEMRGKPQKGIPLHECESGTNVKFTRVTNQDAEFLRYLSESGFELGTVVTIRDNSQTAGIITTSAGDQELSLSHQVARCIQVEVQE